MSDPELKAKWDSIRQRYFPHRPDLDTYVVVWSKRNQKRTLASCNIDRRRVSVARELDAPVHQQWLEPLLYHEMCHAYLDRNVPRNGNGRAWHGPEFRSLESRHPDIPKLDAWIKSGGWTSAVRSHRSREYHRRRKEEAVVAKRDASKRRSGNRRG